jgi:peptide/nickel transport system substrate-binding protein
VRRHLKALALVGILALTAAACNGDGVTPDRPADEDIERGGTLRLSMLGDVFAAFDPQKEYYTVSWEFYRCCLLRTLVSYNGMSAEEGGNELIPDLAAEMPEVSDDGLTWTFRLREGVMYAPPFQDTEIVAQDFVRALERKADPETSAGGYSFFFSVIEGFDDFGAGDADSITGVNAVDDHTLEITLSEPAQDFGNRMALPAMSPIPEGAADGHEEDYGRFLVASGPYMFEGSEDLDFSQDPDDQSAVAGYEPGRSITLVRNPSWSSEVDDIRPAYLDRIEVTMGGTEQDLALQVDAGELDIQFDGVAPAEQVRRYQTDPQLQDRLFIHEDDSVRYLTLNLAMPPFDDVNVRRAVNLAIDKDAMRRIRGGPHEGEIAGHIITDALTDDLLADYDPYETENSQGDIDAAMEAMRQSRYDSDGDGVCDDPVCENIPTITDESDPYPDQAALIQQNLEPLGLTLDIRQFDRGTMFDRLSDPNLQTAFGLAPGWGKDYLDASTFARPLFGSDSIGPDACCNTSLVGATPEQLEEWGYDVTEVPSVDDKIDECERVELGDERFQCFAELDQQLMEEVVPWVPYLFGNYVRPVSARVVNYTFDQFASMPALDHIAVRGGAEAEGEAE